MKIKLTKVRPQVQKRLLFTIMKTYIFLLCTTVFSLTTENSFSQEEIIINKNQLVTVDQVFKIIKQQTNYRFIYPKNLFKDIPKVQLKKGKIKITKLLDKSLSNNNFNYTLTKNNTIVIEKIAVINIKNPQQKEIRGTVKDKNGEPLPGVNIVIKGIKRGTQTNFEGEYRIKASKGQVLVFSYVGYKTTERVVATNKVINVSMSEEIAKIEEVVLTGYRKIKVNEFAGSSVKLKMADIRVGGANTVDKLLQGQASGVSVQSISSVFGTSPKIRIRGSSSITGINDPLWVLDGVVLHSPLNIRPSELYSGGTRNLLASALGGISPNDIEDITILKDATATALYGAKSVNGVIIITTRRAKRKQKLSIDYTVSTTVNMKPTITNFNVLNSAEEIDIRRQLFKIYQAQLQNFSARSGGAYSKLLDQQNRKEVSKIGFRQGLQRIQNNNTDWFDVLFRNSLQQQHSISASYGGEKGVTRASFSYLGDDGYQLGQNVERYTLSSTSKLFLSDKFSAEVLIKYSNRKQGNPGGRVNPYKYAITSSRAMSPYNEKGNLEYYKKHYVDFNIINEIDNDYIDINAYDFSLQLRLDYKLTDDIDITLLGNKYTSISSLRESVTENSSYANGFRTDNFKIINFNEKLYKDPDKPANSLPESVLPHGGILEETNIRTETNTLRTQVNWDVLKNDTYKLNFFTGMEIISNLSNENRYKGYGYIFSSSTPFPDELALKRSIRSSEDYYSTSYFINNQLSFYGSLNYTLLSKYILTASLRNDATNISGTSSRNRFLPTWTVAGAWSLGKENLWKSLEDIIPKAKLRVSYGLRGNAGRRGPDLVAFYVNKSRVYNKYSEIVIGISEPENQDLEFEKEYIFNTGIDLSVLNLFNITANYYYRKNFDLIGLKGVAPSSGYVSKQLNWATMTNEGWELSVSSNSIIFSENFSWRGVFNIGYNKNTVVSNYLGANPNLYTATEIRGFPFQGKPLTGLYSFNFAGLDSNGLAQFYDKDGNRVYGFEGGNKEYKTIIYQGSRDPLYSGGFSSSFTYKNFALSTSFVFNIGHVARKNNFYKANGISALFRDDHNIIGDYRNRWQAPGNEQFTNIPRLLDYVDGDFYSSLGIFTSNATRTYNRNNERTVEASFLRIKTISLKYQFPNKWSQRIGLNYVNTSIQATNPIVFASEKLRGQDPEALIQGTNIPPVKSVTFNLSLGF